MVIGEVRRDDPDIKMGEDLEIHSILFTKVSQFPFADARLAII
jgi:hypothetical protein